MKLGVNLDHVATLRQQRREDEPDLIIATQAALAGGADSITIHLREDRRHIQDADVHLIRRIAPVLNLEMAATQEMLAIALQIKPNYCCIVPEKRQELTTEGGLDVVKHRETLQPMITTLQRHGIHVSLFVDANPEQIQMAANLKAHCVELHTGEYAKQYPEGRGPILATLQTAATQAQQLGLEVHAGHGIKYYNVGPLLQIPEWEAFNIGHSVVSRALSVGLENAVREMKVLITTHDKSSIQHRLG
jgi:pyridoxine 5-phosphate synthase